MTDYLGKHVSRLLESEPFRNWSVERSVEDDLKEATVDYAFSNNGLEVQCDGDENVRAIFMYADKLNGFDESLLDFSFAFTRVQVLDHLGTPSKSKERFSDPVFGECGAWDRFDYTAPDLSAHFEYRLDGEGISKFTLMRGDTVQGYSG